MPLLFITIILIAIGLAVVLRAIVPGIIWDVLAVAALLFIVYWTISRLVKFFKSYELSTAISILIRIVLLLIVLLGLLMARQWLLGLVFR